MVLDLNKFKEEVAALQKNLQTLKSKTVQRLTVTDELGKGVQAFLAKKESYSSKRKLGTAVAVAKNGKDTNSVKKDRNESTKPPQKPEPQCPKQDTALIERKYDKRIQEWARQFRRADPRYQILNFFS